MIFLSWNCKGLANKPKKLALKELVKRYNLDFLLLRETLGKSIDMKLTLRALLLGWSFLAVDSVGHSGGMATGFSEGRMQLIKNWGLAHVLRVEFQCPEFGHPLLILNIYGPYQGRASLWTDLLSKSMLKNQNLLIGGDLNFSVGNVDTLGPSAK